MKITHILAATALAALGGCQPAATTDSPAPTEEIAATQPTPEAAADVTLPCGVLAQRNWEAGLSTGTPASLTVSGEVDLGTPGYSVSLARDPNEADGATTTVLTFSARAPSGMQAQVVTAHPVRYFGPARGAYTSVQIVCDGAPLTTIAVGG